MRGVTCSQRRGGCGIPYRMELPEMVQYWGTGYFTAEEYARLKVVAALYLSPDTPAIRPDWHPQARVYTLIYAADLALVLEDAEARRWVEQLAMDAEAFQERISESESVGEMNWVQEQYRLRKILDGGPMLPLVDEMMDSYTRWLQR